MNELLPGTRIDNYEILGVIGKGGMGIVYKARDVELDRFAAVKMMDSEIALTDAFRSRFRAEAKALARLQHPNIVNVHAFRDSPQGFCIIMEYVDGSTLADRFRQNPSPPVSQVLAIAHQLIDALDHAHTEGVIHRDIKPSNIMLRSDLSVKIMDFGLAKLRDSTRITQAGTTAGSPGYMSPEQIRGEESDHRADVWAMGVVLYEMLTGTLPFPGTQLAAIAYAIMNNTPKPMATIRPDLPPGLDSIVLRCLAKDKDRRYQSMRELREDLLRAEEARSGNVTATTPSVTAKPFRQKSRYYIAGVGIVLVLTVGIVALMRPGTVSLQILSDPPGATVHADGTAIGTTPVRYEASVSVPLTLRFQKSGYIDIDTVVQTSTEDGQLVSARLAESHPAVVTHALPGGGAAISRDTEVRISSTPDLAEALARALIHKAGTIPQRTAVRAFTYQDTQVPSPFANYLKALLESRLSEGGTWVVVQEPVGSGASPGPPMPPPTHEVRGTVWEDTGGVQVIAQLRAVADNALVVSTEIRVPRQALSDTRLAMKPSNILQVVRDQKALGGVKPSAGGLAVELWTNKGKESVVFAEGDTMRFFLRVNRPCYARLIYSLADTRKALLTGVKDFYFDARQANKTRQMGEFLCTAPFGAEMIQVFVRTEPFTTAKTTVEEGITFLAEDFSSFVSATRGFKNVEHQVPQAEARVTLTTTGK
jgi:predicted Ser/Thr protein kinase